MRDTFLETIAEELHIPRRQVEATAALLADGGTIPFIARYRKEQTGSLDEVAVAGIRDRLEQLQALAERREAIVKSLVERQLLTDDLAAALEGAATLTALEDIYQPYRPKRRTRAMIAREKGLEPLADLLWAQDPATDPSGGAAPFVNQEAGVATADEALAGARDILAERVSDDTAARMAVRSLFTTKGVLRSKVVPGKEVDGAKFKDYYEWEEPAAKAPSHRILAIRRGETEGMLTSRLMPPEDEAIVLLNGMFLKNASPAAEQVRLAIEDGYRRLLEPSIETEARLEAKQRADAEAIRVFAANLRELLLSPPLGGKTVLGIDPGFRTGCKIVCLDRQGKLLHHDVIFIEQSDRQRDVARQTVLALCSRFQIDAVAIGNGTASRETEAFVRALDLPPAISVVVVNESGASVYSASEAARDEFPDQDITVRGAVSIGRRLMDPLAELVKIDPKSIGVGQYQHDVDQKALKRSLDEVVGSCVNAVGVEVNTASKQLLSYVSGLNGVTAANIVLHRNEQGPFTSRRDLLKVKRLGPKAFEQAAGFLRIRDGENPLDASAVHPESYGVVETHGRRPRLHGAGPHGPSGPPCPDPAGAVPHRYGRPADIAGHSRRTRQARPRPARAVRILCLRRGRDQTGRPPTRHDAAGHRHQRHRLRGLRGHRRPSGRPGACQPARRPLREGARGRGQGPSAGPGHRIGSRPGAEANRPFHEAPARPRRHPHLPGRAGRRRPTPQPRSAAGPACDGKARQRLVQPRPPQGRSGKSATRRDGRQLSGSREGSRLAGPTHSRTIGRPTLPVVACCGRVMVGSADRRGHEVHEVSLMQDTVIIATRQAREAGAQRIHRVAMKVGALSGAVPETLEFAFEIVAKGTMAEGATLDIERIPVTCFCPACAQEFTPADLVCECPRCARPSTDIRRGRELQLTSLEVS